MRNTKVWMITGASRGFGFEIVKAVLETGDRVVATVRNRPELLLNRLGNNKKLFVTLLDVNDSNSIESAVKGAVEKFGKIDVLVNNAGYGLLGAVEEVSDKEIRQNYETNVFGVLNVAREVLPHMREQRSGHIINISSVGGLAGFPGWGLYCSTKFAVEGLSESMALELAPLGIHVTAVEPGFFRTDFLDSTSLHTTSNMIKDYDKTAGGMRNQMRLINKKQPGSPEKLALAFIKLVNSDNPPVHLILGKDSLGIYRNKTVTREKEIEEWYDTTISTDHDDVAA